MDHLRIRGLRRGKDMDAEYIDVLLEALCERLELARGHRTDREIYPSDLFLLPVNLEWQEAEKGKKGREG